MCESTNITGTRLRNLRRSRKLLLRDVANDLKISSSTLGNYETCNRSPNIEILNELAQYYNVSLDYIVGNTDRPNISHTTQEKDKYFSAVNDFSDISAPGDDNMIKIFRLAKTLDQEHLETVYDFIGYLLSKKSNQKESDTSEDSV